jgi:hypothetical protein
MSSYETVLAAGDISLEKLAALLCPLFPHRPTAYEFGTAYQDWTIADGDLFGIPYDDDHGIPLSQYRFDISTRRTARYDEAAAMWADSVYTLLSERTDLDLLRLGDNLTFRAHRPSRLHPVAWPQQPADADPAQRPQTQHASAA